MDKRPFNAYGLDPPILKRASALYTRVGRLTAPNKGFDVPATALAPICALMACEELGSTKVTERTAQGMACLKQQDWARALRNARAAIELADENEPVKGLSTRRTSTILDLRTREVITNASEGPVKKFASVASRLSQTQKYGSRTSSSSSAFLPSSSKIANLRSGPVESKKTTQHSFQTLSRRYKLDYEEMGWQFERVLQHLQNQGWNEQKWNENINAIRVAIFYWVCKEKDQGLRDLKIIAEETTVTYKVTHNVLKSMETIRPVLLDLLAGPGSSRLAPEKRKAEREKHGKGKRASPSEDESVELEGDDGMRPQAKRQRREAGDSSASGYAPTPSSVSRSATQSSLPENEMDVDNQAPEDGTIILSPSTPSKHILHSQTSDTTGLSTSFYSAYSGLSLDHDNVPSPAKTKSKSKVMVPPLTLSPPKGNEGDITPRKARQKTTAVTSISPRKQPSSAAGFQAPRTAGPRYRPVFPDRAFWCGDGASDVESEEAGVGAENEALEAWMAKTRAMLAVAAT
ncbi:hypothetical protein FRB94_003831 [Tulasnella sp. JGI-2019a]|nr:hypothetical protein FRB94_003831 [Tulasnella sp. JGI-2019a]